MAIGLEAKKAIVAEVNETARNAISAVVADYRGVTVDQMTQLRSRARSQGVLVRVIRNTLAKRAFEGTGYECINDRLLGPNILAFSMEDPSSGAKLFKEFARENQNFQIKALSVGGKVFDADQIDRLAKLPSRDEAISILMSLMLAPIAKLVQTMNDIPARVTRAVAAVRDQKQNAA